MVRDIAQFRGSALRSKGGGEFGKVKDILFDEKGWRLRYLVVDTGSWLSGRKVLVPASFMQGADMVRETIPVSLIREEIENSPPVDDDEPVSRKRERELDSYYGSGLVWSPGELGSHVPPPAEGKPGHVATGATDDASHDPDLRSTREVLGYRIEASDGEIGHVDGFLADDEEWIIRYAIVDTRNWLPGRKVILSTRWLDAIVWGDSKMRVNLTRDEIRRSPEWQSLEDVNREYEELLHAHYGKRAYWEGSDFNERKQEDE